jgi:hypothetical protein
MVGLLKVFQSFKSVFFTKFVVKSEEEIQRAKFFLVEYEAGLHVVLVPIVARIAELNTRGFHCKTPPDTFATFLLHRSQKLLEVLKAWVFRPPGQENTYQAD